MFYADLHVHSRYSRATSSSGVLTEFSYWAGLKGLSVVGTGDFTHPQWLAEIRDGLVEDGDGFLTLRPALRREVESRLPESCRPGANGLASGPTRFVLQVEISTIYKRAGATRKVHHLLFAPGLTEAGRIVRRLADIGNLKSDGRPILGLDSRDLLEITLEAGAGCFLIPAHIWTPWFSLFGSKSGFDAIEDCYGDLASEIFALETGLSSDPAMNWRVSALDRFRLVSNSDAHSPSKLAREACLFECAADYASMREALRTGVGYGGTVEFFPEEGKYHLDGHRKCGVCLAPAETVRLNRICPECGKELTVGVSSRVHELADRAEGFRPAGVAGYASLVPLEEVVAEVLGCGVGTKRASETYRELIGAFGPELGILRHVPLTELGARCGSTFVEAIRRVRAGQVYCEGGYDGEFGVVRVYDPAELAGLERTAILAESGVGGGSSCGVSRVPRRRRAEPQRPASSDRGRAAPAVEGAKVGSKQVRLKAEKSEARPRRTGGGQLTLGL